eukprot:jgi/Mesvir1/13999/Mv02851-RA.3
MSATRILGFLLLASLGLAVQLETTQDYVRSSVDGSSHSQPATRQAQTSPLPVAGEGRTALLFDGQDDMAVTRNFRGLPSSTITVYAWVNVARHKSYSRIMSHEWVNWGWNLYLDTNGVARFGIGQDNKDFTASRILFRNRWHHVAGTYDGTFIRIYVDGMEGARTRLEGAHLDHDGSLSIGGAEWDPFVGALDELALFNVSHSQEQVRARMMMGRVPPGGEGGEEPGLVGYWRLDEGGGHVARDSSLMGNHLELGQGRRTPLWVPSLAPLRVYCTGLDAPRPLQVTLAGQVAPDRSAHMAAYVTQLPVGGVLSHAAAEGQATVPFVGTPTEVRGIASDAGGGDNGGAQVEFRPNGLPGEAAGGGGAMLRCERVHYRVHDGLLASDTAVAYIDVMPRVADCEDMNLRVGVRSGDGGEDASGTRQGAAGAGSMVSQGTCWDQRTRLEHASPTRVPPLVSVVIPLYNAGRDLPETVESVVAQTLTDWEIIIVDDGSTDDSNAVARALIEKYTTPGSVSTCTCQGGLGTSTCARIDTRRMRIVEKRNGGLADARNFGIAVARGTWVLPLDADDLITPTFLATAMAAVDRDPSINLVIADLKGFGAWEYSWRLPEYDPLDLRYANMFHCSALYRATMWRAVRGGYSPSTLFGRRCQVASARSTCVRTCSATASARAACTRRCWHTRSSARRACACCTRPSTRPTCCWPRTSCSRDAPTRKWWRRWQRRCASSRTCPQDI